MVNVLESALLEWTQGESIANFGIGSYSIHHVFLWIFMQSTIYKKVKILSIED
jgi:hypothetical protein